jgi:hypothetical protein
MPVRSEARDRLRRPRVRVVISRATCLRRLVPVRALQVSRPLPKLHRANKRNHRYHMRYRVPGAGLPASIELPRIMRAWYVAARPYTGALLSGLAGYLGAVRALPFRARSEPCNAKVSRGMQI